MSLNVRYGSEYGVPGRYTVPVRIRHAAAAALLGVLMCAVPALHAQVYTSPCETAPQTCPTLISTTATAQTRIPNTAVDITLGMTVSKASLPATQRALADKSATLLTYLRGQQAQRLITTNVSFTPDTRYQKSGPDKTVAYIGAQQMSLRTTPEKAPELLAGALANGANTIDSTTFTPTEKEIDDARRELASEATKTAAAEVESIAKAVGLHLIALRDISVGSPSPVASDYSGGYPMDAMRASKVAAQAPPPIQTASGDQQLSISVSITAAVAH